jgi:hypothetical protein
MPKIGPDGEYLYGKPLRPDDRGGLYAAFRITNLGLVHMDFGAVVDWVAATPADARAQAAFFRSRVREKFGDLPYNASTLPLKVKINATNNGVETYFPQPVQVLVANPEVFLAWADRLEEAANKIPE